MIITNSSPKIAHMHPKWNLSWSAVAPMCDAICRTRHPKNNSAPAKAIMATSPEPCLSHGVHPRFAWPAMPNEMCRGHQDITRQPVCGLLGRRPIDDYGLRRNYRPGDPKHMTRTKRKHIRKGRLPVCIVWECQRARRPQHSFLMSTSYLFLLRNSHSLFAESLRVLLTFASDSFKIATAAGLNVESVPPEINHSLGEVANFRP